jgi:hypothetical protein
MENIIEEVFENNSDRDIFFTEMLNAFINQVFPHYNYIDVHCDFEVYQKISNAYFKLNTAYKKHKIKTNHKTQFAKIAALTFLSSFIARPYYGDKSKFEENILKANFRIALYLASTILDTSIEAKLDENQFERLFDYCFDFNVRVITESFNENSTHDIDLSLEEMSKIGMIITLFELLVK